MLKRTVSLLLLVAGLAGCYEYVPPPSGQVTSGSEVRAVLTDVGSRALGPRVGEGVQWVDGRLLGSPTDSAVTLAVTETTTRSGNATPWTGESVSIPRDYVASLQQKVLSRSRTAAVAGAGAAVMAVAYVALRGIPGISGTLGGGGSGRK